MNLRTKAKETLDDVSNAAEKVVETTNWATVALIVVSGVSVLALLLALAALHEHAND